jgi:hypothetical protein
MILHAGKVEDEIYFLLECGKYVLERGSLLNAIKLELSAKTDASISGRKSKVEGLRVINDKLVVSYVLEGFVSMHYEVFECESMSGYGSFYLSGVSKTRFISEEGA